MISLSKNLPIATYTVINIMITSEHMAAHIAAVLSTFELSISQFNVLRILRGRHGKPTNLSTIQDRMIHKMSNTTRLIDKLIQKEMVTRNICSTNRRKIEVFITKKGMTLLAQVDPLILEKERSLTNILSTNELQQLNILLHKLNTNL